MAFRSLRIAFWQQVQLAERNRTTRRRFEQARRTSRLLEREQRLARQMALHRQRMADRSRKIDAAHLERVKGHRAMLARRRAGYRSN